MIRRLQLKFICINMTVVLLMLGIIFGAVVQSTRVRTEQESLRMMEAEALMPPRARRPGEARPQMQVACFTLRLGPEGELLADGDRSFDLSDETLLRRLYELAASQPEEQGILAEYGLRYCRVDTPLGECMVFADRSGETAVLRGLLKTCLFIGMASTAVFLLISIMLSYWAVGPAAKAWKQQRQFVSDASHELKTPLTVILTNAELLESAEGTPEARRQFLENILVMSREMRGLIEDLLELARADSGAAKQELAPVDFSRTAAHTLMLFEPVYYEKGLALSSEIAEGITVRGNEPQLKQLVEILLDNAQKYAFPGGKVTVKVRKVPHGRCELSVANPGEALSAKARRDIFKRFYRADEARSRNGSYGLGLSIADAIVRNHHGRIWAESGEGVNTFVVSLPRILR